MCHPSLSLVMLRMIQRPAVMIRAAPGAVFKWRTEGPDVKTLALDTNIASYILDGKIWSTSPLDIFGYNFDPHYIPSLESAKETIHVKRCITCFEWAMSSGRELIITPTVMMELMLASQVSLTQLIEEKRWSHVHKIRLDLGAVTLEKCSLD